MIRVEFCNGVGGETITEKHLSVVPREGESVYLEEKLYKVYSVYWDLDSYYVSIDLIKI